ncbi:DciA family protein [Phenylobacterium sp. SCN 70-31]|uniref:DUF721 domain-containing protein n=1 Tax=Phenylobacterium sp. SCN 70-31 TaxID=1660129 RepID=UPI0008689652|nr:DciA family protein [Phenylobacterium sp. SCN 70-31]ODT86237.1 MAG: hypothetical protein ABS78_17065 [Phenylobacterium sp. SCN 70-31]
MRRRPPLPSLEEARAILAAKRTRPPHRPPPPAARALKTYLKDMDGRFGQGADALAARWREVVGPQIAQRTEPVKLTRGRNGGPSSLEIRVAGPAAAIIQHQAHEILARVNLFLGPEAVQKLRIVQGPLRRPAPPPAPRRAAAPLDAAVEAELADGLSGAPEGRLKDALLKLGRGVMTRRAGG